MESLLRSGESVVVLALFSNRDFATSVSKQSGTGENQRSAYLACLINEADATAWEINSGRHFVCADVSAGREEILV